MQTVQAGQAAPTFSLLDQDGQSVSLSDFRDQSYVLLYFYPRAMTPGCTIQACALRDHQADYLEHKIKILGISPDPVSRLKKFQDKENLNFTLLADPDHAVAEKYGVWGPKKFMGRVSDGIHRISFLIDSQGQIQHVFAKVATKTHHQDVLERFAALNT